MRNFNKQIGRRFSTLAAALIISIGIMTACGSAVNDKSANDNASTVQNKPVLGEGGRAEDKAAENKAAAETKQDALVAVYDGRETERKAKEATSDEKQLVEKEFKSSETAIMQKVADSCEEGDAEKGINIIGVAEGSFTKPNSSQKAFLYSLCNVRRGSSMGGIMIVENEKAAAHYIFEISWSEGISSLPDVNKNGLSEIVLDGGGSGQGYTETSINIHEIKAGNFDSLGVTPTYSDNSGAAEDQSKAKTTAYKISVQLSANPVFFRETYEKKSNAKDWSSIKKVEKFSLDKDESSKVIKIS